MAKVLIGKQENIHPIQELQVKGPGGESLYLGYKTTGYYFGAGVYLADDGYVIGVSGTSGKYIPMPAKESVSTLQHEGAFPDPLPPYSISHIDYAFGYSAWLLIAGIVLSAMISVKFKSKER